MGFQSEMRDALLPQPSSFKKKKEYTLEKELGRGAFGKVIKANWKPPTGGKKDVALKVIKKDRVVTTGLDVMAEVRVLKGLDHPNIVHLWDNFESRDKYYFAFELATGGDVFQRIYRNGKFLEKDAQSIIRQVLSGVAYLHSHNIIHRDLKPENILFLNTDPDSPIVIADFGIAKVLETESAEETEVAGSAEYLSPEMLAQRPYGVKVDIWAIGTICFMFLCGYPPYRGDTVNDRLWAMEKGTLKFHSMYWRNVTPLAKDFCQALLTVDPKKRLSAKEALDHEWIGGDLHSEHDLSRTVMDNYDARSRWSKAFNVVSAAAKFRQSPSPKGKTKDLPKEETSPGPFDTLPTPEPVVTPLSMTDVELTDDDHSDTASFVTCSERDSIGPATPSKPDRDQVNANSLGLMPTGKPNGPEDKGVSPVDLVGINTSGETSPQIASPTESPTKSGYGTGAFSGLKGMMGKLRI